MRVPACFEDRYVAGLTRLKVALVPGGLSRVSVPLRSCSNQHTLRERLHDGAVTMPTRSMCETARARLRQTVSP